MAKDEPGVKRTKRLLRFVILLCILTYAASSSVSAGWYTSTLRAHGSDYSPFTFFPVVSAGFHLSTSDTSASAQPCQWSSGQTCSLGLQKGQWYYEVALRMNTIPQGNESHVVKALWREGASGQKLLGEETFTVSSSSAVGGLMVFCFEAGSGAQPDGSLVQLSVT